MVSKSWGRAISGPVLAVVGLGLLILQQMTTNNETATIALKCGAWLTLGIAAVMILVSQYKVWKEDHIARLNAEDRLVPRLVVRDLVRREWGGGFGVEFYFEIFNQSETETIENVAVELVEMSPDVIGYLPVRLHIKHDESYTADNFSINAGVIRHVDLITGPTAKGNPPYRMMIPHIVNKERKPIPFGEYALTVVVSGSHTTAINAQFKTWIDKDRELRCIRL
jgi:hypothetical protein